MAAKLFFLPHLTATVNGIAVPGAKASFCQAGTTTPLPVYQDAGLAFAHSNPVIANGAGRFPAIYLDDTKVYRLILTDSNDAELAGGDIDPFLAGIVPDASALQPYQTACEAAAVAASASADDAEASAATAAASATTAANAATDAIDAETNSEAAAILAALAADAAQNAVSVSNASLNASTRGALSLLSTSLPAILTESGREGIFVFSSANLSANVALDPQQAIYVAPTSDATGASGAWVRRFSGAANVRWWGATGDGTTSDATAFTAALAYLRDTAQAGFGYTNGAGKLFIPKGVYNLGTTSLDIYSSLVIEGEGGSGAAGGTSVLKWTGACDGIRVQLTNTSGATTVGATGYPSAAGSVIRNLYLKGSFVSGNSEGEYHGIRLKATTVIQDVFIADFPGDGIYANAQAGAGSPLEGNVNLSKIERVLVQRCRNGIVLKGADANACLIIGANCASNRACGIREEAFLGNFYYGCHTAANGWDGAGLGGTTATACSYLGNRYYLKDGQATGASTNAPTGTTADNTWWGYIGAGGTFAGMPAWVSGTTFREGGGYFVPSAQASNASSFDSCYSESDQDPSQLAPRITVNGGFHAAGLHGGASMSAANNGLSSPKLTATNFFSNIVEVETALNLQSGADINLYSSINGGDGLYLSCTSGLGPAGTTIAAPKSGGGYKRLQILTDDLAWVDPNDALTKVVIGRTGISSIGAIGYATSAGGTVTQATSKATGVTLDKVCGSITLNNAALAANTIVSFTLTNSQIAAHDDVRLWVKSGNASAGSYRVAAEGNAAGSRTIVIENKTAGSLSEAVVIGFNVLKAVAS